MSTRDVYQVNLQNEFGGGEVYTRFFSMALIDLGYRVVLFASRKADFWESLLPAGVELVRVDGAAEILRALPQAKSLVVTQTALDAAAAQRVAERHVLCGFVHMPLYERDPAGLRHYHFLLAVSRYVLDSIRGRGYSKVFAEPMYGVADPRRGASGGAIVVRSEYDWDRRKLRDRLLGLTESWWRINQSMTQFSKRPGLTLGIVSRLTPIKQFSLMFGMLAPVLARYPQVNLEIFGSGGYASVRDLRASLAPMGKQVRFWGQQPNVAAVYPQLDFVLSGLPEKEALGLNLIEAQYCGTPVLAVRAPPFTETVIDGRSGFFFSDPREDGGESFAQLLQRLLGGAARPDPRLAAAHLERFSFAAFRERVARALDAVAATAASLTGVQA
ncbi:MAG: glycosyltransferase family 4 protein [Betaproteobacteria bacterium]|nr:glycosyltransferase family 4 protein [Betaproteobacteria bacterium]